MAFTRDARIEFSELTSNGGPSLKDMQETARTGKLRNSRLRGLHWKIFLGALSAEKPDAWRGEMSRHRKVYLELSDRVQVNPGTEPEDSLEFNNPLSTSGDSSWAKFFEDDKLRETIQNDIERTHSEMEFFQQESTQQYMLHILFVWSKLNPAISYRQGMNELLAVVLYVVAQEAVQNSSGSDDLFSHLHDKEFIEHDAHFVFSKIMDTMAPYFRVKAGRTKAPSEFAKEEVMPLIAKCREIQGVLLPRASQQLATHFKKLEIEPQIYALRWVRLMFAREFHLADVCVFWDSIFAVSADLSFVDQLSIAMLLYVESQLVAQEYTHVLRRLMRYPPVEDVTVIIRRALNVRDPRQYPLPIAKRQNAQRHLSGARTAGGGARSTSGGGAGSGVAEADNGDESDPDDPRKEGYSVLIRGSHAATSRTRGGGGGGGLAAGANGARMQQGGGPRSAPRAQQATSKFAQLKTSFSNRNNHSNSQTFDDPLSPGSGGGGSGAAVNGTNSSHATPRPKKGQRHQAEVDSLRAEVAKLEEERRLMATRLEEIVGKFQEEFGRAQERTSELLPEELRAGVAQYMLVDRDEFIESLAEVKQVRTVLSGFLDAEAVIAAIEAAKSEQQGRRHPTSSAAPTPTQGHRESTPTVEILSDDEEPAPPQKVVLEGEFDAESGNAAATGDQVKARSTNEKAYQEAVGALFGSEDAPDDAAAMKVAASTTLFGDDAAREEVIPTPSLNPADARASTSAPTKKKKKKKKKSAKEREKLESLIKEGFGANEEASSASGAEKKNDSLFAAGTEVLITGASEESDLFAAEKSADGDLFSTSGDDPFAASQKPMRPRSPHTPPEAATVAVTTTDLFSSPLAVVPAGASTPPVSKKGSTSRPNPAFGALSEVHGLADRRGNPPAPAAASSNSDSSAPKQQQFMASSEKTSNRPMLFKKNATTREYVPEITFESPPETHDLFRSQQPAPAAASSKKRLVEPPLQEAKPDFVGEESPL